MGIEVSTTTTICKMKIRRVLWAMPLAIGLCGWTLPALAAPSKTVSVSAPVVLDSVVAAVDEKPITLRDLEQRLSPPRKLSLAEASQDPQLQALLDRMIFEQAVMSEAESKKIEVDDSDIDRYMEEVAKRNNLTKAGLEKALAEQHKDVALYRTQIKLDILQSRLGSSYLQSSGAITREEVDGYLQEHPELLHGGTQIKVGRILVSTATRSEAEAETRAQEARAKIKSGEQFAAVAKIYSDAPEAAEGGSLGLVAEKDLSSEVFNATMGLNAGELSDVIKSDSGFLILQLEERLSTDTTDRAALEEEVRQRLQGRKQQSKLQDFFTTELFKNHTVEKKI